ncbi:hypothetical protein AGMMS50284_2060 [Clostridia bacterium]|nr:hypothetical protein AGMMS50284_2060 [Clostridia bacterium]
MAFSAVEKGVIAENPIDADATIEDLQPADKIYLADADNDRIIAMEDVVLIQKIIAKSV